MPRTLPPMAALTPFLISLITYVTVNFLLNLSQRVFIFSGQQDNTVNPGVVRDLEQMYRDLGVKNILTNYNTGAGHSFPTKNYGNPCGTTESPYITDCGFDGAGAALQQIYGKLKPSKAPVAASVCMQCILF